MSNLKEENFYELVNQYLDLESIYEKLEKDKEVENHSDSLKKSPFSIDDTISINSFVNKFLNIQTDATNLYHCGLKKLNCPYVIGVSNEFANKNPEYVKLGFLLIVIDAHKNRGTYFNPIYLHKVLEMDKIKDDTDNTKEFYDILKSQKKLSKVKSIKRYERIGE